jgi:glycosyltransferase involved in cell wall biosynthesis
MQRKHIAHIVGTLRSGGVQTNLLNIIDTDALHAYNHSIICIVSDQGELREHFETEKVPIFFCPIHWPAGILTPFYRADKLFRKCLDFTFPHRLLNLLEKIDADLVHSHISSHIYHQSLAVIRFAHLPWVWTLHGLYRSRGKDTTGWSRTIRLINKNRAYVTAVSHSAMSELTSYEPVKVDKQTVIPNGVDLNRFSKFNLQKGEARQMLGIPQDALVFGTAGRLIPVKRHDLLIQAASEVLNNGLDVYFLIAGEGSLEHELNRQIEELRVKGRVLLIGQKKDILKFLSAIDVFILTSDSEALPLALIEACAVSIPWIATSVGGLKDDIWKENGLLFHPGSVQELVDAICMMSQKEYRQKYSSRAKKIAENFSHSKIAAEYARVYEKLIAD